MLANETVNLDKHLKQDACVCIVNQYVELREILGKLFGTTVTIDCWCDKQEMD